MAELTDVEALLQASAAPSQNTGPVLTATLAQTTPVTPVPGGAIPFSTSVSPQVNIATVDTAPPADNFDVTPLLWIGAGIGTAWLLTRSDRSVSGPKQQKWLVPTLILGAGAAWYFFGDKVAPSTPAATTTTPGTTTPATTTTTTTTPATATPANGGSAPVLSEMEQQRQQLQQLYPGQPNQLAALAAADAETLRRWALAVSLWNTGVNPYTVGVFTGVGAPKKFLELSVGKWWDDFAAKNNFG